MIIDLVLHKQTRKMVLCPRILPILVINTYSRIEIYTIHRNQIS